MFFCVIKIKTAKKISLDRGVINGKAGKAAALSKFSDTYVNSIPTRRGRADHPHIFSPKILPLIRCVSNGKAAKAACLT